MVKGFHSITKEARGRGNGEKWKKMAKNGDGEFVFFICQIRIFSPIFDFGISHLTDVKTANCLDSVGSLLASILNKHNPY